MLPLDTVNWIAVVIGMLLSMVAGALWYGPIFGKLWLRLIDKTMEEIEENPMDYLKTAIAACVAMLFLNMVVVAFGARTFGAGLLTGALVFIGFGATQTLVYTLFEGPKESVWLLHASYQLIVFTIMGGVFSIW